MGTWADKQEMSSGHQVVDTRGPPDGRFTFTSHEAGTLPLARQLIKSADMQVTTASAYIPISLADGSTQNI